MQVKHLENRNYLIFTFTFRMDGQPNVISAESPEHHKVSINCMCPDKKYDFSLVIAKKETLLDMDTQAKLVNYSRLRLIEPPVNRFHCLMGSKFHKIYRTELHIGLKYFRLIDFSA